VKLGVLMDPIEKIHFKKDTTLGLLLEAQARGWSIDYFQQHDLYLEDAVVKAKTQTLTVKNDPQDWFSFTSSQTIELKDLDVVLMRKDPPFDMNYVLTTYLLELAAKDGVKVFNDPKGLRDVSEKLFASWFPQCLPPYIVTASKDNLKAFLQKHHDIVLKPINLMGGQMVYKIQEGDPNLSVIIDQLTKSESRLVLAQRFIPELADTGDKSIILINGEPVPYGLARFSAEGEFRANLAAGGKGVGVELTERDLWICQQVGATLKEKGILFAGLDVIGDYLTEINVTSPTCIREIEQAYDINIAAQILDAVEGEVDGG